MRRPKLFFVFFILAHFSISQISAPKNEDEQKKLAEKLFEAEDYGQAYRYYSTLLSNYPKDSKYNYRIGVCILQTGDERGDRKKSISYLEFAKAKVDELEKEVLFYLGKAYHVNYRFDDAIKSYNAYKSVGSSSMIKRLKVEREIQSAQNGKKLLSRIRELMVMDKKRLTSADYFRSYDQSFYGGNLLVRPDDFRMPGDMKKKDKVILFQSKDKSAIVFSSYGESGERGKDIYMARRGENGEFSKPFLIPGKINTEFDEDYPYLHPNGKHLFFCSKGHNSMGGYDIFKSEWNEVLQEWGMPVNLDFPINTPYDDIQFVTDSSEKLAIFSSNRISETGKIDVYKVSMERRPSEFSYIAGEVMQETSVKSKQSKISVKDIANGDNIGTFSANAEGRYSLQLPNGGRFILTVETPGFATQSGEVQIPLAYDLRPYRQIITYENEKLIIKNFFDPTDDETAYQHMRELLEEKMKMNVNTELFQDSPPIELTPPDTLLTDTIKKDNGDVVVKDENKQYSNKEMLQIAKNDLAYTEKEWSELKTQSENAASLLVSIKEALSVRDAELVQLEKQLSTESREKEKLQLELAEKKQEAERLREAVNTAQNYSNSLKVQFSNKEKEKQLEEKLVKAMTDVVNVPKNKEKEKLLLQAETELLEHQKVINQSQEEDLLTASKTQIEAAELELKKLNAEKNLVRKELSRIENEIKEKEEEIKKENDKDLKENLNAELSVLKEESNDALLKNQTIDTRITNAERELDNAVSQNNFVEGMMAQSKSGNTDLNALLESTAIKQEENLQTNITPEINNSVTSSDSLDKAVKESLNQRIIILKQRVEEISNTNKDTTELKNNIFSINDYIAVLNEKLKETKDSIRIVKSAKEKRRLEKQSDVLVADQNSLIQKKNKLNSIVDSIRIAALNGKEKESVVSQNLFSSSDSVAVKPISGTQDNASEVSVAVDTFAIRQNELVHVISGSDDDTITIKLIDKKLDALSNYNLLIESKISENKKEIKSVEEKEKKRKLENENADLANLKKENNKQILSLNTDKKNLEKQKSLVIKKENESTVKGSSKFTTLLSDSSIFRVAQSQEDVFTKVTYSDNASQESVERSKEKYKSVISGYSNSAAMISSSEKFSQQQIIDTKIRQADSIKKSSSQIDSLIRIREDESKEASSERKNVLQKERDSLSALRMKNEQNALQLKHESRRMKSDGNRKFIDALDSLGTIPYLSAEIQSVDSQILVAEKKIKELDKIIASEQNDAYKLKIILQQDSIDMQLLDLQHQAAVMRIVKNPGSLNVMSSELQENKILRDNIKETDKIKHLVLQDLIAANQTEFNYLDKQAAEARKQSIEKNSPEAKLLSSTAKDEIKQSEMVLKKSQSEKDPVRKTEMLEQILERQQAALLQQKKVVVIYEGGDPDTVVLSRKSGENLMVSTNLSTDKNLVDSSSRSKISTIDTSNVSSIFSVKDSIVNSPVSDISKKSDNQNNTDQNVKSDTSLVSVTDSANIKSETEVLSDVVTKSGDKKTAVDSTKNTTAAVTSGASRKDTIVEQQVSVSGSAGNRLLQDSSSAKVNPKENGLGSRTNTTSINPKQQSGFAFKNENIYSDTNPIPIDNRFPDGIIYTIQIGAFRSPIPNSSFKGLSPVNGTRTTSGFIRYQAGIFYDLADAKKARDEMRGLGFRDAFVAVYKNNQRVSLAEALRESGIKDSALITSVINTQIVSPTQSDSSFNNSISSNTAVISTDVVNIGGLFFTVQIGVFGPSVNASQTYNLKPLNRNSFTANSFRYSSGIYADINRVKSDRKRVQDLGISDAFVTAYYKGERISIAEALRRSAEGTARFETEQPIIFPGEISTTSTVTTSETNSSRPEEDQPFTNKITIDPVPTAENGVKLSDEGIVYKIQIGAFSKAVPIAITSSWMKIQTWPIRNYKNANGLTIYTVGSFSEFGKAGILLSEMVNTGIRDAFITVFKDGKRLYGTEAAAYLR